MLMALIRTLVRSGLFCLFIASSSLAFGSDQEVLSTARLHESDWPLYGLDYTNQRYSLLKQINRENISRVALRWSFNSGIKATFQATPIVVNGVMYLSLPFDHVVALDAKNGKVLWRYEHKRRKDHVMCCGPANRGVAVKDNKVFIGTVDARLVALDAKSGAVLWNVEVASNDTSTAEDKDLLKGSNITQNTKTSGTSGVGINMAPMVFKDKVLVGITGVGYGLHLDSDRENAPLGAVVGIAGSYGRPGFLAAFDANTGKRIWQFDTIASSNWEGEFRATTPDGISLNRNLELERASFAKYSDAWRYGGGSAWSTPTIDTERGLLYFGTGNPSPQMEDVTRPGDNLYSVSLVCLDVNTGKLRWHYQQVPHDVWGYDVSSPAILFDLKREGHVIAAVGQASKLGWFYVHDRETGRLLLKSEAFVPQENMFTRATAQGSMMAPGVLGGASWSPSAIDEKRQVAYVAAIHWPSSYVMSEIPATADKPAIHYTSLKPGTGEKWGLVSAIDLVTGKLNWQYKTSEPLVGGVLATEGGLLFTGEGNGNFNALDASNGKLLWQYHAAAGVNAPPITYEIDGVQYVAVAAGGNQIFGFAQGDALMVFALPKNVD
jgi:glucose dehydrogenase